MVARLVRAVGRHVGGGAVLLRPSVGAALHGDVALRGHRVAADGQLDGLEALDLVAQARGLLELEVGGGLAHALLQVGERGLEVVAHAGRAGDEAGVDGDVVGLVDGAQDVLDAALDGHRRDAVLGVVGLLLLAAAGGLGHGALHGAGDLVGVEDDLAVDVAGGAADGLDQRGLGAQEALLVGVEDGDEAALGDVEALRAEG